MVAYTVIYMILKSIQLAQVRREVSEPSKPAPQPKRIEVEITSRDLYCKAENLIQTHEIYSLQAEQLMKQINEVEEDIKNEQVSVVRSDDMISKLVARSLRLRENKCAIESKMLKISDELDKIALEEYKRKMAR